MAKLSGKSGISKISNLEGGKLTPIGGNIDVGIIGFFNWVAKLFKTSSPNEGASIKTQLPEMKVHDLKPLKGIIDTGYGVTQAKPATSESLLALTSNNGDVEGVKALIGAGADVNHSTLNGVTPLKNAVHFNNTDVVQVLLDAGAKLVDSDTGPTLLGEACANENLAMVRMIAEHSESKSFADSQEAKIFMFKAAEKCDGEAIKFLVEAGVSVNIMDSFGETPLTKAAACANPIAAKLLIDAGANVNVASSVGISPLFIATEHENTEVIEVLLKNGAKNIAKIDGETPLSVAKLTGNTHVVEVLEKAVSSEILNEEALPAEGFIPSYELVSNFDYATLPHVTTNAVGGAH